jgi:tetratricopeptide (TPR) repeat protein
MEGDFEHQRFSLATFVGVNFAELETYFTEVRQPVCEWIEPMGQAGGIHSRLLTKQHLHQTAVRFLTRFGQGEHERLQQPVQRACQWLQVGRFELAAAEYQEAVQLQPYNLVLLNEIALFLIFSQREVKAGIDLAKLALAQNPRCSAELWNILGDGLFEWGRLAEARSAYQKAIAVNESDIRARYNLAWVSVRERDAAGALQVLAEAIALDKTGQYRERLLQKQQEALALLQARNQQEYLLLINLVSRHAPPVGPERESGR